MHLGKLRPGKKRRSVSPAGVFVQGVKWSSSSCFDRQHFTYPLCCCFPALLSSQQCPSALPTWSAAALGLFYPQLRGQVVFLRFFSPLFFNKPGVCQLPNGKGMLCVATGMAVVQRQGAWPVPFSGAVVGKWVSPRDAQSPRSSAQPAWGF